MGEKNRDELEPTSQYKRIAYKVLNGIKHISYRVAHFIYRAARGMKYLLQNGPVETLRKIKKSAADRRTSIPGTLDSLKQDNQLLPVTHGRITFSILVPLYNTPKKLLTEMIDSVLRQNYVEWELCMADGSDRNQDALAKIIRSYTLKDNRIRYINLNGNRGIALNTAAAYEISTGEYIVLLDHDDMLSPDALYELSCSIEKAHYDILYSDRLIFSNETRKVLAYHHLPGFSPDYLRSNNYMSHLIAFSRSILTEAGFERAGYDGSQDYDLLLRTMEKTHAICHIPKVLYWCRACEGSVALDPESKRYAYDAGEKAIAEHIGRIGCPGRVEFLNDLYAYRIHYELRPAKVSVIIPNKDNKKLLMQCIASIREITTYRNYEIIIAENNSSEESIFDYYKTLESDPQIIILHTGIKGFNYSMVNNFAAGRADGEYLLLLNNDIKVITPNWIEEMLMYAQRRDVGAVGAKLLYPNNTIQHCGLVIGLGEHIASNHGHGKPDYEKGYMNTLCLPQNYSAVSAACLMVKKSDYFAVGGLDEVHFPVGLNDVDFCLKLCEIGRYNVWTPYAQLYHHEGKTRGKDLHGEKIARFRAECNFFKKKWHSYFTDGDPYNAQNFKGW